MKTNFSNVRQEIVGTISWLANYTQSSDNESLSALDVCLIEIEEWTWPQEHCQNFLFSTIEFEYLGILHNFFIKLMGGHNEESSTYDYVNDPILIEMCETSKLALKEFIKNNALHQRG